MKNLFTLTLVAISLALASLNIGASQAECKLTAAIVAAEKSKRAAAKQITRAQKLKPLLYNLLTSLPESLIDMLVSYDYLFEGKELLCRINHQRATDATAVAALANDIIAIGFQNGTITLWNSSTGNKIKKLINSSPTQYNLIYLIKQLPYDPALFSSVTPTTITVHDVTTGEPYARFSNQDRKAVEAEPLLQGLFPKKTAQEAAIKKALHQLYGTTLCELDLPHQQLALVLNGYRVKPSTIIVASKETGETNYELIGHKSSISTLALLPDNILASGSLDGTIRIWNLKTGVCLHIIPTMQPVCHLTVTEDGKLIACFKSGSFQVFA